MRRCSLTGALGLCLAASVSCSTGGTTAGAAGPAAPSQASSTWLKRPDAKAEGLVTAGLLGSGDVGSDWKVIREGSPASRPTPQEPPPDCPFTNDFYKGAVLGATSPEFERGDLRVSEAVMVFESEEAAKAAMAVRQRERDEQCTRNGLSTLLASRRPGAASGTGIVSTTQEMIDGPGYADEEQYTALGFEYGGPNMIIDGGVLYSSSRIGRAVVLVNAKDMFEPIREMPPFVKAPLDRLRAAGAG